MKVQDIKKLNLKELNGKELKLRKKIMDLRFLKVNGKLTDTAFINKTRKFLARILTIQNVKKRI